MAGMRLATAVAMVAEKAEAYIAHHARESERGRDMLLLLSRITGEPLPSASVTASSPVRVDPGTVPARVLEVLAEAGAPMAMKAIVAALSHSTKAYNIETAVRTLVKAGRIVATGATFTRRYSLPAQPQATAKKRGKKGGR